MTANAKVQEEIDARRGVYQVLARVFRKEVDGALLEQLESTGLRTELQRKGFQLGLPEGKPASSLTELLSTEYARLFIGPGPHVAPYASVHSDREGDRGRLWGDTTVEVKSFIETAGLEFASDYGGIPDQLAIELEFMARLTEAEREAACSRDRARVQTLRSIQARFLREYLLNWFPSFARKVAEFKPHPFYAGFTAFCQAWLTSEEESLRGEAAGASALERSDSHDTRAACDHQENGRRPKKGDSQTLTTT